MARGADTEMHGNNYDSALDAAVNKGNIAVIDLLLEHGAILENSDALQRALFGQDAIPVMAHLLDRGHPIHALEHQNHPEHRAQRAKVESFQTALHIAVQRRMRAESVFLLDRGVISPLSIVMGRRH